MEKSSVYRNLSLLLILLAIGAGFYFYPRLPEQVVSHWDISGHANGYMGRFWGTFLFPIILLGIFVAFRLIPLIVWQKTHHRGERVFKIAAVIFLLGLFFPPKHALWFILVPIFASVLYLIIYSYREFKKQNSP